MTEYVVAVSDTYEPDYIRVKKGDRVIFIWQVDGPTVTSNLFDTGHMAKGGKFILNVVEGLPFHLHYRNRESGANGIVEIRDSTTTEEYRELVDGSKISLDPCNEYNSRYINPSRVGGGMTTTFRL